MKEFKTIVTEYKKIDFSQHKAALATVVKVRGSSYRSPGARMLITDDGRWVGSISGGCLEGDALRKARLVMQNKIPMAVTYDTREESNQNLGIGLGCNGVIDVLIEPIDPADSTNPVQFCSSIIGTESPLALATIFRSDSIEMVGNKILVDRSGGYVHNTVREENVRSVIVTDLIEIFQTNKSQARAYSVEGNSIEVYLELIQPSISVIIFGGGFDARPVSVLAKSLGWDVSVTDECVAHIAPVFFPAADKLSLCDRSFVDRDFNITAYTACILMSHNYEYDRDVLKKLLKSPTPYIGILGPRKRFDKMVSEFETSGIEITTGDRHRIHSPIGVDIGAETPDEIAVAIVAEIQAKFLNRSGGFLKYRQGPIHHRDTTSDQVFKHVFLNEEKNSRSASH
jgi:xanthine/CO dehydrogenase XdhC/CoxF family maturation factor